MNTQRSEGRAVDAIPWRIGSCHPGRQLTGVTLIFLEESTTFLVITVSKVYSTQIFPESSIAFKYDTEEFHHVTGDRPTLQKYSRSKPNMKVTA